ncbi:MAG: HAD-IIIC family phosphatase [Xenococcaceae cyanobacterium MO_167.B27]|nr:HAD-IIIC family phosphatase [Xenococcaceae cyanobacterium MO_167.B27]
MITADLTQESPLKQIRQLKRSDRMVSEFPKIRHLLHQLTTQEDRARAGQMLKTIDRDKIIAQYPEVKTLKIALTGNFVSQSIAPFLVYFHLRDNILIDTYFSDYGQYTYELINPSSELYNYQSDLTICLLEEHIIFDELPTPWRIKDVQQVLDAKIEHLENLATRHNLSSRGLLICNTIPLSANRINQLIDYKSKASLSSIWKEFNARLLKLSTQIKSLIVLDIEPLLANATGLSDDRLSQYTKMYLTESLLCEYAAEISKISRAVQGQSKKCLVLDLDNTLWKGILGDDGLEGIEVADSSIGEAFNSFQRTIKQLADQGILLAINSKNDLENVQNVLQNHPKMELREEDFVKICANWSPKSENMQYIAKSLNLNLDSFVFVDDSPFERELVRSQLPKVTVLDVEEDPSTFITSLLSGGWFNILEITQEDYSRTVKYANEVQRQDFLSQFNSLENYLQQLQLKVRLFEPQPEDIARISQLTLRTNQFNMTTKRYQEAEIEGLLNDPLVKIVGIQAKDRFGDNGIVGCIFAHQLPNNKQELYIDNFILSCRVFSRGIETISLEHLLQTAKQAGITKVYAKYSRTAKNLKVREFYKKHGFSIVEETGTNLLYLKTLDDTELSVNSAKHIELQANYGGFNYE